MKKIAVLGGGSWGTALSKLLCENGHDVKVWLRDEAQCNEINKTRINYKYLPNIILPDSLRFTTDMEEALGNSEIIINVIPTQNIRKVFEKIPKEFVSNKIIINCSKGIELGTHCLISDIIKEGTINCDYVILSGPSHAEELGRGLATAVTVASESEEAAMLAQDIFMTDYFRVYTSKDVKGVELGGALKNIIALGAGISDGVGYGDNAKAALMTRGILEISRLGACLGAEMSTFQGLSGVGDLIATCTSQHSRNRNAGLLIGQGLTKDEAIKKIGMVVEGISTTYAVYEIAKEKEVDMPIVFAMHDVLDNSVDVKETVTRLMLREKKEE
jgi:glycerol-3-phosphate dehydrogenase (NAD(P)+)